MHAINIPIIGLYFNFSLDPGIAGRKTQPLSPRRKTPTVFIVFDCIFLEWISNMYVCMYVCNLYWAVLWVGIVNLVPENFTTFMVE
jgi:hypothetical protein